MSREQRDPRAKIPDPTIGRGDALILHPDRDPPAATPLLQPATRTALAPPFSPWRAPRQENGSVNVSNRKGIPGLRHAPEACERGTRVVRRAAEKYKPRRKKGAPAAVLRGRIRPSTRTALRQGDEQDHFGYRGRRLRRQPRLQ